MQPPQRRQSTPWCFFVLSTLCCCSLVAEGYKHNSNNINNNRLSITAKRRRILANHPSPWERHSCLYSRGGAILRNDEDEEESEYEEEEESDEDEEESEEEDEEEETQSTPVSSTAQSSTSGPPVSITIRLSTGNRLLDDSLELQTVGRHRTIAFVKQSVSRRFSGKPPKGCIQLIHEGIVLDDDTLIDELLVMDEDDEEEEEDKDELNEDDSNNKSLTLLLDIVPTVDPKTFLVELDTKLADATTLEILEAFVLNEAAVNENYEGMMMMQDSTSSSRVMTKLKDRAAALRQRLDETHLNTDNARSVLANTLSPNQQRAVAANTVETKGDRVRHVGSTSPRHVRRSMQQYLNVEWGTLIKHTLLFVFFGYFGGHNAKAKTLLYLGAPAVVILQTRPVKFLVKQVIYALLYRPPGILLSLLPAPQQAIVSLDGQASMQEIYGKGNIVRNNNRSEEEEVVEGEFQDAMEYGGEEELSEEEEEIGMVEEDYAEYDEEEEDLLDDDDDEYNLE